MRTLYSIIIIFFLFGATCNSKPKPEEIVLNFIVDSLINEQIFHINQPKNEDELIIPKDLLISERLYKNGFLNGFRLYSEGLAYGFPEEVIPMPMTKKEYKEWSFSKSMIKRNERILEASSKNRFNPTFNVPLTIKIPKSIQLIQLDSDKDLIQQDSSIYIRVFRALETDKEFLVQLTLYENFIDLGHHTAGFIMEFIINKNNGRIEWDISGSYH